MVDLSGYSTTAQVIALCRLSGVTPRMFEALMRHFGALQQIFDAGPGAFAAIDGVNRATADRLNQASHKLDKAAEYEKSLTERDIQAVTCFEKPYPELFSELHDPPPLVYYRGRMPDPAKRTIAVVGSRNASTEGIELTTRLVKELAAEDIQVVSSLAGGTDVAAHLAARAAGGVSFAVIDSGIEHVDIKEGIPVALDIVRKGGVIFEYSPETEATDATWREANRLIVGMSQAVVVTEAYSDSERVLDMLKSCHEIGKLAFFMIDTAHGALADKPSLERAIAFGAIPIEGCEKIPDIIRSLV